jgi:hypothetical protein
MRSILFLLVLVAPLPALADVVPSPASPPGLSAMTQAAADKAPDLAKLSQPCLDQKTCPCEVFMFTAAKPVALPQPVAKPLPALW